MSVVKVCYWEDNGNNVWQCPECNAEWTLGANETPETMEMNYCYKCGTQLIVDVTLKPCPFCGGEADAVESEDYYVIWCADCGIHTPHKLPLKDGVTKWQKRKSIVSNSN